MTIPTTPNAAARIALPIVDPGNAFNGALDASSEAIRMRPVFGH